MIEVEAFVRRRGRALVASVAICLLLLRALIVILGGAEAQLVHSTSGAAQTLCAPGGGPGSPTHSAGDRHCVSCALGERQRILDTLAAAPAPSAVPTAKTSVSPARHAEETALHPVRCACSWSSRAPPAA